MVKITFILAESALETIPQEIRKDKIITSFCQKKRKKPEQTLLDQSYHHKAASKLNETWKRGRPDITHFSLLEATSIPLYFEGQIDIYVHIINDKIIQIGKNVRLPKVYERFVGLIEKLFIDKKISYQKKDLLTLSNGSLEDLLSKIKSSTVIGFSRLGKQSNLEKVANYSLEFERPVFIVGGFARGHFSDENRKLMNNIFSISQHPLEAHVVTARILYEMEKQLYLSKQYK